MTKREYIDAIFNELKNGNNDVMWGDDEFLKADQELRSERFIKIPFENQTGLRELTQKGDSFIASGLSYEEFNKKENETNIHIGDKYENNQNSSFINRNNLDNSSIKTTNAINPTKKSKTEPIYMICMIVFGLITVGFLIWEFWIKHISIHQ